MEEEKKYTKQEVELALKHQRHNCQIERNKLSYRDERGNWYVACEGILQEPLVDIDQVLKNPLRLTPEKKFIAELESFIEKLNAIDKETPWKEVEPRWWLGLSELRQKAIDTLREVKVIHTLNDI